MTNPTSNQQLSRLARSNEYLGKDRDQLREIILDRDEEIAQLSDTLQDAREVNYESEVAGLVAENKRLSAALERCRLASGLAKAQIIDEALSGIRPDETAGDDARDAARYRFLRQPGNAIVYAKDRNAWGQNASGHVRYDTAQQLDAAVDAARGSVEPARELSASEAASFEKAFAKSPRRVEPSHSLVAMFCGCLCSWCEKERAKEMQRQNGKR